MKTELLHKYFRGETTEKEENQIVEWVESSVENKEHFLKERMLFDVTLFSDGSNIQRKPKGHLYLYPLIAIAAMLAIVFVMDLPHMHKPKQQLSQTIRIPAGQRAQMDLPDGSIVWLNSQTTLTYDENFGKKDRKVTLDGEAYFEVTKNRHKPFTVESDAMRVRVLGTTFNFKCDKRCRIAEATLIEGEIEVKGNKDEGQIVLAPGQRAELNRNSGRLTVKQVDAKLDAVWRDNLIPFNKANIFTITKALERFYDVKIILSPDIRSDKTYSGVLKKKSTIESVLKSLQNSIPIEYKIVGNNIFISSDKK